MAGPNGYSSLPRPCETFDRLTTSLRRSPLTRVAQKFSYTFSFSNPESTSNSSDTSHHGLGRNRVLEDIGRLDDTYYKYRGVNFGIVDENKGQDTSNYVDRPNADDPEPTCDRPIDVGQG
ncbi:hypothetical protein HAX54_051396 [Datura stramonium]|uniref:Uncharacterized protein n=1 Tax=Datura stramonium TaxID=4076 RepID=A0ABS8WPD8_DATST|nr:hypothetical protein [Datura stramonium]